MRQLRSLVMLLIGLAGGMLASFAQADEVAAPLDFTNDVLPVLTKHACNSGGCHGKGIGQNGFKLSLFGFDPAFDYAALVHEGHGRRVSPAAPDDSLFLLKASGALAHGGGVRFTSESSAYKLLRRWVEQGLPWGAADAPRAVKLDVQPRESIMTGAGEQPLKVVAHYGDGTTRDVTPLARYDTLQAEVVGVSSLGVLQATGRLGEGDVMIRYDNLVASARIMLPLGQPLGDDAYAGFKPKNFIDELALAKWRTLHIAPSPPASDAEFLRRVYLQTMGILPTPQEIKDFVADAAADKRDKLIDAVLERPEYADLWTLRWGEILRNRLGDSNFKENSQAFAQWVRKSLVDNKPYDQFVREILTAMGQRSEHPQIDWWRQAVNQQVRVEDSAQAFLGVRVSCANCHNHPFENISQTDYWQYAAFFAKVDSPSYGEVKEIKMKDDGQVKHPRTDKVLSPKAFHGPEIEYVKGEDPRIKLVDWMTTPDNPYFAKALVNRVWGHYLGAGLVDPVDDLRATNPPSNAALLDALAQDFVAHKFDIKHLQRTILKSQIYGLSSLPTEQNQADTRNFARHYPHRLSPHVLLDAISQATGTSLKFDEYPDIKKAVQLPNEKARSEFLDMFGRSQRDTPCECETSLEPNIGQVMYLLHSDEIHRKLTDKQGLVVQLAGGDKPAAEIVDELFLHTFSRPPTPEELQDARKLIEESEDKKATVEDLLWVLLNSKEFLFCH